jgi:hypothetical protein
VNISDEAVEAATEAMLEVFTGENEDGDVYVQEDSPTRWVVDGTVNLPYLINHILEAAAPYIAAGAWEEGRQAEEDTPPLHRSAPNPYKSQA